jgi:hypothetical protein
MVAVEGAAEVPGEQEGQGHAKGRTPPPSRTNQAPASTTGRRGDGREGHHQKIFSMVPATAPDAMKPLPGLAALRCSGSARGSAGGHWSAFWSGSGAGLSAERSSSLSSDVTVSPGASMSPLVPAVLPRSSRHIARIPRSRGRFALATGEASRRGCRCCTSCCRWVSDACLTHQKSLASERVPDS